MNPEEFPPDPVPLPIGPELDLHGFRPAEVRDLLPEYFAECRRRGIHEIRVVHGRGTGQLRAGVLELLKRLPEVESFAPAAESHGGWGATWVRLRP